MNIAELQQFIKSLVPPLTGSGAPRKITDDLERICTGLEPFRDKPIAEFADFLVRAEEYHRTGIVPGKKRASPKPQTIDQEKVLTAAQGVKALFERAFDAEMSAETLNHELEQLIQPLNTAEIVQVAQETGAGQAKTKKAALEGIGRMIRERKRVMEPAATAAPA
jgi:copper homeostasis protein CutC